MTDQTSSSQSSADIPPAAVDGSYLDEHVPYEIVLEGGVLDALSQYAPQVKHIRKGTVICDGRKRLVFMTPKKLIERPTLISVADLVLVKYGRYITTGEINAMQLVREQTSVPVPNVLGYHEDEHGYKYIVMTYIKGSVLWSVWDSFSERERDSIINQLKSIFEDLHSVRGTYIGGIGRLSAEGPLFWPAKNKGPYRNEYEMNEAILRRKDSRWKEYGGYPPDSFVKCILPGLPTNHDIVLSHGQVLQEHIIVEKNTQTVTGILGWSQAGFFPEYWDSVYSMCHFSWRQEWIQYIPCFLKPYTDEYALWYQIQRR